MSFSDALNKAKAAAKTEKAWEGVAAHRTQTTAMASQPRNMLGDEEDEEKEEVELRMPGSFDFGFASPGGMARETLGVETTDPIDAVGVLGNLWWRMQVYHWYAI